MRNRRIHHPSTLVNANIRYINVCGLKVNVGFSPERAKTVFIQNVSELEDAKSIPTQRPTISYNNIPFTN